MQITNLHGRGFLPEEKQAPSDRVTCSDRVIWSHPVTAALSPTEKPISPDAMSVCACEKWMGGREMKICASEKWIEGSEMRICGREKAVGASEMNT